MNFKKLLAIVCSCLLITTSFIFDSSANTKNQNRENVCSNTENHPKKQADIQKVTKKELQCKKEILWYEEDDLQRDKEKFWYKNEELCQKSMTVRGGRRYLMALSIKNIFRYDFVAGLLQKKEYPAGGKSVEDYSADWPGWTMLVVDDLRTRSDSIDNEFEKLWALERSYIQDTSNSFEKTEIQRKKEKLYKKEDMLQQKEDEFRQKEAEWRRKGDEKARIDNELSSIRKSFFNIKKLQQKKEELELIKKEYEKLTHELALERGRLPLLRTYLHDKKKALWNQEKQQNRVNPCAEDKEMMLLEEERQRIEDEWIQKDEEIIRTISALKNEKTKLQISREKMFFCSADKQEKLKKQRNEIDAKISNCYESHSIAHDTYWLQKKESLRERKKLCGKIINKKLG